MIPQLESLLMAPGDIETYRLLGVEEELDRYDQPDPTLTSAEASALAALQFNGGKYLRTEQERIPASDAESALEQALAGRGPRGRAGLTRASCRGGRARRERGKACWPVLGAVGCTGLAYGVQLGFMGSTRMQGHLG
jgi:Uncharacterized protein conserved in bacteria C-term(DUF2220)